MIRVLVGLLALVVGLKLAVLLLAWLGPWLLVIPLLLVLGVLAQGFDWLWNLVFWEASSGDASVAAGDQAVSPDIADEVGEPDRLDLDAIRPGDLVHVDDAAPE